MGLDIGHTYLVSHLSGPGAGGSRSPQEKDVMGTSSLSLMGVIITFPLTNDLRQPVLEGIYKPGVVAQELPRLGQWDHRGCESCATEGVPSQPVLDGETLSPPNKIKIKGHQKEGKKIKHGSTLAYSSLAL